MSDKYRIDSHKLNYHPERLAAWRAGKLIYPLYMEISPIGSCNHRCRFCGLDFMGYNPRRLETPLIKERLTELGGLGLKSAMFAGEGEPFLHKNMAEIAVHAKDSGIDVAFTTNAVLLKPATAERILGVTSWIKVSFNAGTPETYARVHGTRAEDFATVVDNLSRAVEIRRTQGASCTLGMQILLLPENAAEVPTLARLARDIGLDYLVVKPYSQHPQSLTKEYGSIRYGDYADLAEELAGCETGGFSVIFRHNAMQVWDQGDKGYKRCLGLPFWSYIDAGGGVWGCSVYLGDERFLYGNIHEQTFREIWEGERRRASLAWVENELDPAQCRVNCRMDPVNRFLWELKNPPAHVNFI